MRELSKVLKMSVLVLALVVCVYIAGEAFTGDNQQQNSANTNALTTKNESIANIGDILETVAPSLESSGGDNPANENVKTDYKPVKGTGQLVEESKTKESQTTASTASYTFPENMYPYRAMLNDTQKSVYDQIYSNVQSAKKEITLCKQLDQTSIKNVMNAIFNDHPEFFWLDTGYSYGYTTKGTVISVALKYNSTADNLQTSKNKFLNAASKIINGASELATDLEKEEYVYKKLQNMCEYNEEAGLNQSAYSVLVNGSSVCAGYSRAFQYIMQQLNIPCYFCTGYANGGQHAWNIIYIDGQYYNVDLSWDDSLGDMSNSYSFAYYNLTDKAISVDHTRRDLSLKLPLCK